MLRERGLTLIELMVALAIGLALTAVMAVIFSQSTAARYEINRYGEQIENGRFAMSMLEQDLSLAGMWEALDVADVPSPTAMPDPCEVDVAKLKKDALPLHVQAYNDGAVLPSCISDVRPKTDVLVIRRASTCVGIGSGANNCAAQGPYFLASTCSDQAIGELSNASADRQTWYDVQAAYTSLSLHDRKCAAFVPANVARRYLVHIYYIANNTESGDGIPALKMVELQGGAFNTASPVTIASGIEQMQFEFGLDTDNTDKRGLPDAYGWPDDVSSPDKWRNVVTAKVYLLARSTTLSPGWSDDRIYTLGSNTYPQTGVDTLTGNGYRRKVFSGLVRLINPASARGGS